MERQYTQSYFIFDSEKFKIAREFYFGIDPVNEVQDDEFIGQMMEKTGGKATSTKKSRKESGD